METQTLFAAYVVVVALGGLAFGERVVDVLASTLSSTSDVEDDL
ncbi:hypothetical protein [Halobaculum sp. D14]